MSEKTINRIAISILICGALALIYTYLFLQPNSPYKNLAGTSGYPALPDHTKTPGATNPAINQSNMAQNICNPNWSTKSIRPAVAYTNKLKLQQLANGYSYNGDTTPSNYEEDHLISLELGGNPTDSKNLWPEYYNLPNGARQKDQLENTLHKMVCNSQMTLSDAQSIISTNWYAEYQKLGLGKSLGADTSDPDDN